MLRNALAAILALCASVANATVAPIPFLDTRDLNGLVHRARFPRGQPSVPQISYNIVTDGGAACNGNVQNLTRTVTITNGGSGNRNVAVSVDTFVSGDAGKTITIDGAGASGGRYVGTIATFTDARNIILGSNVNTVLTSVSTAIAFGTNDAPAFDTFNNWARANQGSSNQVVLTIPAGKSCWFGSGTFNYVTLFNAFAAGINNLIVEGNNSTLNSVGGTGFTLGTLGVCQVGLTNASGCSARIQSASAGASTITLTAASLAAGYISRFTVDRWIMVGALDIQGLFQAPYGYPPNQNYFEWRKVTAVNAGTGEITLDRPLTYSYSSALPNFNSGSNFEADNGGPATIWAVGGPTNSWNTTVEYRNLTISQEGQTYSGGRYVTYRGVIFTGAHGGIPTQNESWSAYNSTFTNVNMETDKLVGTVLMDGVTINQMVWQSSSIDLFILRNSTVTNRLDGGARRTEITDSTLNNWGPGVWAYGNSIGAAICTRCNITTLNSSFGYNQNPSPNPYTMTGGLITSPNSVTEGQKPFVPGARLFFSSNNGFASGSSFTSGMYNITTVTGDGWPATDNQTVSTTVTTTNGSNNIQIATNSFTSGDVGKTIIIPDARNCSGNCPLYTYITAVGAFSAGVQNITLRDNATLAISGVSKTLQWGTSNTYAQTSGSGSLPPGFGAFKVLGNLQYTCDACTGDPNAVGTNIQQGATPLAPLGTYTKRTYSPTTAATNLGGTTAFGKVVSLTVDVTQPFVGTGTASVTPTGQFFTVTIKQSDWSQWNWFPTINLKQAGRRVITPGGVTCDTGGGPVGGACSGDTINSTNGFPPEAVWLSSGISPWTAGNFSGMTTAPTFSVTIQTDQSP